jgi:hypothetical protein
MAEAERPDPSAEPAAPASSTPETPDRGAIEAGLIASRLSATPDVEIGGGRALALRDGRLHPGEVILALARAARSFITYDARNETVRQLIHNYRETVWSILEVQGAVSYEVRPFEIAWGTETIYSERDREKSLAFRLFRDGVRKLTLKKGVPWEELLRLLEIMSIRYSRIRQHEEDTLTLLRQAQFQHIEFEVVDVYVPSEENPEGEVDQQILVTKAQPPADWDLPLPRLGAAAPLQLRPLAPEALAALQREGSEAATVEAAIQVVREMLDLSQRQADPQVTERVLGLLEDICKFFIVELRPKELVWTLREAGVKLGDAPGLAELRKKFDDAELLDRFLRDPDDVSVDALMPLFAMVSGDHLDRVIDRFLSESEPPMRAALKTLLARLAIGKPDALLGRLGTVPTERVVDLFNVVCVVAPPERCIEAAFSLAEHSSPDVQLGALEVLAGAPVTPRLHETLQRLISGDTPRVRVKTENIYGKRGGSRAYTTLLARIEELAKEGLEPVEAAAIGRGLVASAREHALPLLRGWARSGGMKGLMLRAKYGGRGVKMLRWAAATGLAEDRSEAGRDALSYLAEHGDEELAVHCREMLEKMGPLPPKEAAKPAKPEPEPAKASEEDVPPAEDEARARPGRPSPGKAAPAAPARPAPGKGERAEPRKEAGARSIYGSAKLPPKPGSKE